MRAEGETDAERAAAAKDTVVRAFGWTRIDATSQREFYARDQQGRMLWLKARSGRYKNTSWDWTKEQPQYDLLVGIIVETDGEISIVFQAPRPLVERLKSVNESSYRLRWNKENAALVEVLWQHPPMDVERSGKG